MVLMRGVPGSGKSTKAKEIARAHMQEGGTSVAICATDDYHMKDGVYVFQREKLGYFHTQNCIRVYELMKLGIELVIVDNTNIKRRDMQAYVSNAGSCGYEVQEVVVGKEFLIPSMDMNPHAFNDYIQMCAQRNTHGVPKDVIDRMARTFQK